MPEAYTDWECRYLGGDPRLDERGAAVVQLQPGWVRIEVRTASGEDELLRIPAGAIEGVRFEEQSLNMEEAEYEEDTLIGEHERLIRPTVVIIVKDPEGILPGGIRVRLAFRNEYTAKLFEKRCIETYKVAPF